MAATRYVITGPDGCGKSTLVDRLTSDLEDVPARYMGKRRSSGAVFDAVSGLRAKTQKLPIVAFTTRMFFFSVELADLWAIDRASHGEFYLVERHYFDRVAYLMQLALSGQSSPRRRVRYWIEWPVMTVLNRLYARLFAKRCVIRVVLADAAELYARKPEDYTNEADAALRRKAYLMAADWWVSKGGTFEMLTNNTPENFEALVDQEKQTIRSLQDEFSRQGF